MSEDFKQKLRDYADGKLPPEEKAEIEREIDKMEEYQAFLEEELGNRKPLSASEGTVKKETGIIKRAKWKARVHNALTALAVIFAGTVLCGIITTIYYSTGNPDRVSVYRDVVQSTIAVTEPNLLVRGSGNSMSPFFSIDFKGQLKKQIGSDYVDAGDIQMSFLFNQASFPERKMIIDKEDTWPFRYPASSYAMDRDWAKLEKLPDGTVAEAYLSFDKFYTTDETLKKFKDKNMGPVWFVVDTGYDDVSANSGASFIGFPYQPVWHPDDWTVTSQTYGKVGLFGRRAVVSGGASAPTVEDYGSAELRNKNFMKTLELLRDHENIANRVALGGGLKIPERIDYLKKHGVKIYGIVVTGPSKEILKLKSETWVAGIHLGEVRLWNWDR